MAGVADREALGGGGAEAMIGISTKLQRQIAVAVAAAIGVVLAATDVKSGIRVYSLAGSALGLLYLAYERFAWRWAWVRRLTGVPMLDGTWRGVLATTFVRPGTEEPIPPKPAFLVVRQSGNQVHVGMLTDEMVSVSDQASLTRGADSRWTMRWTYRSDPLQTHRLDSPAHRGAAELRVPIQGGDRMLGSYFTERRTTGDLTFDERLDGHFADAAAAETAFRASASGVQP
jgi:hypothetical protein